MNCTITLQEFERIDSLMQEQLRAGDFETCEDPRAYIKRENKLRDLCIDVLGYAHANCFDSGLGAAAYLVTQALLNQIEVVDELGQDA